MSLDVYLESPETCPNCGHAIGEPRRVYSRNITHNLGKMAAEAGLYDACWHPDRRGWARACDLIEPLRAGLERLRADEKYYRQWDAPNGWGLYEHLVEFVADYLAACELNPNANVRTWV